METKRVTLDDGRVATYADDGRQYNRDVTIVYLEIPAEDHHLYKPWLVTSKGLKIGTMQYSAGRWMLSTVDQKRLRPVMGAKAAITLLADSAASFVKAVH